MWSRSGPHLRSCTECGARVEVDKHEASRQHVYCSSGCRANGWRRVHGLDSVPEWTATPVDPSPVELLRHYPLE